MSASTNVRSLLRNERKARRIEHPHATYNSSGVLACQLCHISIKAESLWNQHIHGSHHRGQLQRLRAAQASQAVADANAAKSPTQLGARASSLNRKKRKADDDRDSGEEEDEDASRKKTRAATASTVSVLSPRSDRGREVLSPSAVSRSGTVDEAEWEAFNREMASSPPAAATATASLAALTSAATISAAPVSAQELAARSREEASIQARERKETEAEGEREDAEDRILEEIDEMELLSERVKRLKEKREALRAAESTAVEINDQQDDTVDDNDAPPSETSNAVDGNNVDESESDDDEDDWATWPK